MILFAPGQKLLSLEALKMQAVITTGVAGRVADIPGDLLMTIEA